MMMADPRLLLTNVSFLSCPPPLPISFHLTFFTLPLLCAPPSSIFFCSCPFFLSLIHPSLPHTSAHISPPSALMFAPLSATYSFFILFSPHVFRLFDITELLKQTILSLFPLVSLHPTPSCNLHPSSLHPRCTPFPLHLSNSLQWSAASSHSTTRARRRYQSPSLALAPAAHPAIGKEFWEV